MNKRILFVDDELPVPEEVEGRTPSSAQPAARAQGESRGAAPRTRRPGLHEDTSWSHNHA
jgi:hypothetical protein